MVGVISIVVQKDTKKRFETIRFDIQSRMNKRITQDELVSMMMNCWESNISIKEAV